MSDYPVNTKRRNFLIAATSAVAAAGIAGAAVPFVRAWLPSAKARAVGAPLRLDISKLQPGELLGPIEVWRGKPIFVIRRTEAMLSALEGSENQLADPGSERLQQPQYAQNAFRARSERPDVIVLIGLCTHLGCSPKYYGKIQPEAFDANWQGGFFCPCHGSRFDLSGRVYKRVPAPTNLEVPPYFFESDEVLLIGLDEAEV